MPGVGLSICCGATFNQERTQEFISAVYSNRPTIENFPCSLKQAFGFDDKKFSIGLETEFALINFCAQSKKMQRKMDLLFDDLVQGSQMVRLQEVIGNLRRKL